MRQLNRTKRRLCTGAFVVAAAPVLLASVAYACTNLTNLAANPGGGAAGTTIEVSGSNYRTEPTAGPIEIRLDSRTSEAIASLPTSSINAVGRTMSMSVTIPANAAMGYRTLLATQRNTSTGALLSGFPVRATYKVTSAAGGRSSASESVAVTSADPAPSAAPTQPVAATVPGASAAAAPAGPGLPNATEAYVAAAPTAAPTAAPLSGPGPVVGNTAQVLSASAGDPAAPPAGPAVVASSPLPTDAVPALAVASETSNRGLIPAASSSGAASVLPQLTLGLGAAVVLLALLAFARSGRSMWAGRRLITLA